MHSCIFIFYNNFAVQYIDGWYVFSDEWNSNNFVFISGMWKVCLNGLLKFNLGKSELKIQGKL